MGENPTRSAMDTEAVLPSEATLTLPSFATNGFSELVDHVNRLSNEEEDELLKVRSLTSRAVT